MQSRKGLTTIQECHATPSGRKIQVKVQSCYRSPTPFIRMAGLEADLSGYRPGCDEGPDKTVRIMRGGLKDSPATNGFSWLVAQRVLLADVLLRSQVLFPKPVGLL